MIEKGQRLKKGDILCNNYAGKSNPYKYIMYVKRGSNGTEKTIDCLAYDGSIIRLREFLNQLIVVGHLDEYDKFVRALKTLKNFETK